AILVAGWWYLVAVRRLATAPRTNGRRWRRRRTAAWLGGLATMAAATQSGLAAYDTAYFSAHVIQHLLIGMLAPVLLALGAPVTLALQSSSRPTRRRIRRVLHSPIVSVLTHPLTAWVLFGGSMFALYFTDLYARTLTNPALHAAVHAHFALAGCLFFWPVVGIDPIPHRLPFGGRMLYVLVALPFHTILGVALVTQTKLVAPGLSMSDQQTGAGILWTAGELVGLVAMMIVGVQWMQAEEREAIRQDRRLDRLDRLNRVNERDGRDGLDRGDRLADPAVP
ncbi:MAG: cytochrome c oxidase assembly protein, partial [Actinomycetota bacterium]|nr:cytochrome c oxidase assembly protein [Actinomycetota bacterium]